MLRRPITCMMTTTSNIMHDFILKLPNYISNKLINIHICIYTCFTKLMMVKRGVSSEIKSQKGINYLHLLHHDEW